jgi:hypothetical protein
MFQQVEVLSRQRSSQPGSYPSGRGGNEAVEAWEKEDGDRPSASWQAVTCVNTETAPKGTMRRPTLPGLGEGCHGWNVKRTTSCSRFAGVVGDSMPTRSNGQHGKPDCGGGSRLSQRASWTTGRGRVSEGFIVPWKPGNAGGGKEPWFQDAEGAAREGGD